MEEQIEQGNPSEDSVPSAVNVAASEGQENAVDTEVAGLTLEELNATTGKQYATKEEALKGIKETQSYVGRAGQDAKELTEVKAELDLIKTGETKVLEDKIAVMQQDMRDSEFYRDNPEFGAYKDLIKQIGGDPSKVVEEDAFKNVYEKAKAGDEAEKAKSVLQSNPRLGAATDKLAKAQEAIKDNPDSLEARGDAVGAVIDAFPIK